MNTVTINDKRVLKVQDLNAGTVFKFPGGSGIYMKIEASYVNLRDGAVYTSNTHGNVDLLDSVTINTGK